MLLKVLYLKFINWVFLKFKASKSDTFKIGAFRIQIISFLSPLFKVSKF
jgi:hypothetical protein